MTLSVLSTVLQWNFHVKTSTHHPPANTLKLSMKYVPTLYLAKRWRGGG